MSLQVNFLANSENVFFREFLFGPFELFWFSGAFLGTGGPGLGAQSSTGIGPWFLFGSFPLLVAKHVPQLETRKINLLVPKN